MATSYERVAPSPTPHAAGSFDDEQLNPPNAIRDSFHPSSNGSVDSGLPLGNNGAVPYRDDPRMSTAVSEKGYPPTSSSDSPNGKKKRPLWVLIAIGLAILAVIVLAVILPVYFKVIRPNNTSSSSSTTNTGGTNSGGGEQGSGLGHTDNNVVMGGDGTTITTEDGSTFVYKNSFGGYWVQDPNDPFNDGARPQSWSPALNETWKWDVDVVRG